MRGPPQRKGGNLLASVGNSHHPSREAGTKFHFLFLCMESSLSSVWVTLRSSAEIKKTGERKTDGLRVGSHVPVLDAIGRLYKLEKGFLHPFHP